MNVIGNSSPEMDQVGSITSSLRDIAKASHLSSEQLLADEAVRSQVLNASRHLTSALEKPGNAVFAVGLLVSLLDQGETDIRLF